MSHFFRKFREDAGVAVAGTMLIMLIMAAVVAGFTALVITDTRVRELDSSRTQAFYAVHAGLEKMTADLGDLFNANVAPTAAQVNALAGAPPGIGVTWDDPTTVAANDGYRITFPVDAAGNATASIMTVASGPFMGLVGMATPYTMSVTGRVADRSEASLTRTLQTVAIPIFQFGIFSETDLSFFAGPDFNFGGRVHTNGNLFLAEGDNNNLTFVDNVTAVKDIVRTNLSNGWNTNTNYTGVVEAKDEFNNYRGLAPNEGSLVGTLGSADNPAFYNLSTVTYKRHIMNGDTGALRLDLPITRFGATPIDLIKRAPNGENVAAPNVLAERFYTLASVRILLSDTAAELTAGSALAPPGLTATAPMPLLYPQGVPPPGYVASAAPPRPRFAQALATAGVSVPQDTQLLGGVIKIEKQTGVGVWTDVTAEIMGLGINSPQLFSTATGLMSYNNAAAGAIACRDWTPNAVIRIQRMYDVVGVGNCVTSANAMANTLAGARRYTPLSLYDPRESLLRDTAPASMQFGGVMYYVELDAQNLARWFRNQIPAAGGCPAGGCTGGNALNVNGYTVYFSDRRTNKNAANVQTGEYGFEDNTNPATGAIGTPNNVLDQGEDYNANNIPDNYGKTARLPAGVAAWAAVTVPLTQVATPWSPIDWAAATAATRIIAARRNPPIFFRRALKITRGSNLNAIAPGLTGLTIASENPVYIQGDWNANAANQFNGAHVATSVLADAVTLLSNNWNDANSFVNPHALNQPNVPAGAPGRRNATTTWYRVALLSGKGLSFDQPAGTAQDYGTDGGAHNFLRYLEHWGGQTLNYRGSLASMYHSRQAVGTYKCCTTVYSPPTRAYAFDLDFLTPALLPPRTPMFRDVNITGFAQVIRP